MHAMLRPVLNPCIHLSFPLHISIYGTTPFSSIFCIFHFKTQVVTTLWGPFFSLPITFTIPLLCFVTTLWYVLGFPCTFFPLPCNLPLFFEASLFISLPSKYLPFFSHSFPFFLSISSPFSPCFSYHLITRSFSFFFSFHPRHLQSFPILQLLIFLISTHT